MTSPFTYGMGWLPEMPDFRDYRPGHKEVQSLIAKTAARGVVARGAKKKAPPSIDLCEFCSPVEDQGTLGSCTAHAAVGLVEYFERKATQKHIDASRLFVYKVTRNLMHAKGDSGGYLRSAMQALVMFGAPPEEYWPYRIHDFDEEPPAFAYSLAMNCKAVRYFRLDEPGNTVSQTLARIREFLAAGYPSMFGFTVYSSIDSSKDGKIAFPEKGERVEGGHAIMTVGYDDAMRVGKEKGALLIRNSWGAGWGSKGYGWLPYAYVEAGLADDFWSIQSQSWVDTGAFG